RAERLRQEGAGLVALLAGAGHLPGSVAEIHLADRLRDLALDFGDLHAGGDVRLDHDRALAVDPVERADAWLRLARDEIGDRHRALRRLDAQLVERRQRAPILGQAEADIDRVVG